MQIKIKRLSRTAIMPNKDGDTSSGYNLYVDARIKNHESGVIIGSGGTCIIPTGIAMEIPEGYFGAIYAKTYLAWREGLRPASCVGIVRAGDTTEIKVALRNDDCISRLVKWDECIAQIVIQRCENVEFEEVSSFGTELKCLTTLLNQ